MNTTLTRLKFNQKKDFRRAESILLSKGYMKNTSIDKGMGYFSTDEHWFLIDFNRDLENIILPHLKDVNYELKYVNPRQYVIFNQGGYLD